MTRITELTYRHAVWLRVTHWVSAICLTFLLMSGLQIFNAHPALYIGKASDFADPVLAIGSNEDGTRGVTAVLGHELDTTGALGLTRGPQGLQPRAFPAWITLPGEQDLATGRRWHFLFAWILVANGFVYLAFAFASGHVRADLWPRLHELAHIPKAIVAHAKLRFAKGAEARHYNILQKLTYAGLIFLVLPLLVLAGICMSPGLDTAFPWLLAAFGGRQSARTVHFMMASLLLLFVFVHVAMVVASGPFNNLRSMITGRYAIEKEREP
jgi:thiosulfate reductase cytochrome b subunit